MDRLNEYKQRSRTSCLVLALCFSIPAAAELLLFFVHDLDLLMLLSFLVLAGASAFWWRRWAGTPKKEEKN